MCSAGSFCVDKFTGVLGRSGRRTCSSSYEIYSAYTCPSGYQLSGTQCKVFTNNATTAANSTSSDRTLTFVYGPEHQRIQQVVALSANAPAALQSGAGTTYYFNGEDGQGLSYEKEVKANDITEYKHYLAAGGMVFAMQVSRSGTLSAGNPATANTSPASLRYMHHDHLGSVAAVTDGTTGTVIERLAFDPWGKRRNVNGQADVTDALVGQTTDRGYTEHEHLDEMGLIHMNGRVYDPLVGRMMSADPFIQAPGSLQSYNRYSYVMNNPLNLTDPSGYFSLRGFLKNPFTAFNNHGDRVGGAILGAPFGPKGYHAVFNFLQGSGGYQLKSAVLTAASGFCYAWAAACNAGAQAGLTRAYGGSDGDALRAGAIAGVSTGAFQLAGGVGDAGSFERYLAHAGAGCVSAAAGGGNCGRGAVAAVFGKFATNATAGWENDVAQFSAAVVAGGVGSVIGGGKFENGAVTAAYGYLFNELQHARGSSRQRLQLAGYAETEYSDGTYCNIQGGNGSCGYPGATSNGTMQAGASGGITAAVLLGASIDMGPVRSTDGSCAIMRNGCVIAGPIFGMTADVTLLNVSAGSPSDGWSVGLINKAATPIGGYSVAPGYGSDGWTIQAGRSFGTMLGWGVKACVQIRGSSCAGN